MINTVAPEVGVLLGSKSDLPLARKAGEIFAFFAVPWEITIASAHRTPEDASRYAANASGRGVRVLIAVAGLSAALPGVAAAHTTLPVIGVPVNAGSLGGLDALLSVAQMPPGVPVGSMGVDGIKNAALFAVRILALSRPELTEKLSDWTKKEEEGVRASRQELEGLPTAPDEAFQ
ncbi:MAG: 5-(carboxyamino)imidazole ribonucleotide mutase [Synergistaceae bacterium]|nr:5-(carboxyamino)imidazole ribonucleotide mutase [Synergistaceae bacterium]